MLIPPDPASHELKVESLFQLKHGDVISSLELNALIVKSKSEKHIAKYGATSTIYNTPMQGINWIGPLPKPRAVLLRSMSNDEKNDWVDLHNRIFRYAYKKFRGQVRLHESANRALWQQPQFGYPLILLLRKKDDELQVAGQFSVRDVKSEYVEIGPFEASIDSAEEDPELNVSVEGLIKYVSHRKAERNQKIRNEFKKIAAPYCELCGL